MNVLAVREATRWAADYCRTGKVGGVGFIVGRGFIVGWGKVGGALL